MSPLSLPVLPHLLSSNTWTSIALWSLGVLSTILAVGYIYLEFYQDFQISYKNVPGPPRDSFFWGNFKTILDAPPSVPEKEWVEQYGHTIRFKFMLNSSRLFTTDTTALSYILNHSDVFQKPTSLRRALVELLGNGLLVSEGHEHKRQRKILQSAFNPANIRGMIPIFYDKAYELKDKIITLIEDPTVQCAPTPTRAGDEVNGGKQMDVMKYLGQATLDVIGLAGFDYDFKALSEPRNELAEAYRDMFAVGQTITPMSIFQEVVPGASYLPTKRTRVLNSSRKIAQKVGLELLAKKKRAVLAAHSNNLEKGTDIGKDLLSIVVKANMTIDLRDDQRLPDEEVLAQITTFMLAGNETSSTALTWILHLLALHPGIQRRLREEVTAVSDDRPEMDVLNTLPLLDNVIRESLRLLGPVPLTVREAQKDTVIPLGKPLRGRDGTMLDSVTITKGTTIVIPLMSVNTSMEIWGPDAGEFNPDRYDSVDSEKLKHVPGIWGNLLSFLGGTRNCIGYRFALAEIKVILFILIRNLEFQRLKSQPEIEQKASIVMRPRVKGEEAAGLQMPLMVIPLSA